MKGESRQRTRRVKGENKFKVETVFAYNFLFPPRQAFRLFFPSLFLLDVKWKTWRARAELNLS
jgi:hypothetical protein